MLYLILTIIAIGVLLLSEAGKSFLSFALRLVGVAFLVGILFVLYVLFDEQSTHIKEKISVIAISIFVVAVISSSFYSHKNEIIDFFKFSQNEKNIILFGMVLPLITLLFVALLFRLFVIKLIYVARISSIKNEKSCVKFQVFHSQNIFFRNSIIFRVYRVLSNLNVDFFIIKT